MPSRKQSVAIIGGGLAGLAQGVYWAKRGFAPTIFEASNKLGGLAAGERVTVEGKTFFLQYFYHHFFEKDKYLRNFLQILGLEQNLKFYKVQNNFGHDHYNPCSVLLLGLLLISPVWKPFARIPIKDWYIFCKNKKQDKLLNLLRKKFGEQNFEEINTAWLWARLHSRFGIKTFFGERLGIIEPNFDVVIRRAEKYIKQHGGRIYLNTRVENIQDICKHSKNIIFTVPMPAIKKILGSFASRIDLPDIKYRGAFNFVVISKEPLTQYYWDQGYIEDVAKDFFASAHKWKNIHFLKDFPFLIKVEQTLLDKNLPFYVIYLGGYVDQSHPILTASEQELIKEFKTIFKLKDKRVLKIFLFRTAFAQHIPTVEWANNLPLLDYSLDINGDKCKLYIRNFDTLIPWDRGVNYAVRL